MRDLKKMLIVPNAVEHLSVFCHVVIPGLATIMDLRMVLVDQAVLVHPVVLAIVAVAGIRHQCIKVI